MRGDVRHDQVHEGDVLHLKLNCKSERRTALATSEKSRIDFSEMFEFSGAPVCVLLVLHEVTPLETMDHVSRGCAKHRCMLSGRASKKKKKKRGLSFGSAYGWLPLETWRGPSYSRAAVSLGDHLIRQSRGRCIHAYVGRGHNVSHIRGV